MIGIDWGTTSFRAYRLAAGGALRDRQEREAGILAIPEGGFPAALHQAIDPWLAEGEDHVLLCGMVGSRQGWVEAPYLSCPAGPAEIAAAALAVPFDGTRVLLLPGLSNRDAAGVPDVMRGEETKLVGLLAELGTSAALVCLPGTHTKWARLEAGRIAGFATHMTGELRAVLLAHSILGRLAAPGAGSDEAFLRGVARAGEAGGLAHQLFGTRALGLFGELAPEAVESYLSGLLIGAELRAVAATGTIHLAGSEVLVRRYALALRALGLGSVRHDDDIVARGLTLIAERLA